MPPDAAPQGATAPVSTTGASSGPATSPGAAPAPSQGIGTGLSGTVPNTGSAPASSNPLGKAPPASPFVFQRQKEDGTLEEIDIGGFKTKLKVDGREIEMDLPRLVKLQQLEHTSNQRLMEHKRLTAELQQREKAFSERMKKLSDPDVLLSYLVDTYGDKGIFDRMAQRMAEHERFNQLPEAQKRQILAARESERRHQAERAEIEREKAKIEAFKQQQAREREKAQMRSWKAAWPEQFKAMGLPIGEHTETITKDNGETVQADPVFREVFNRTLSHLRRSQQLKLGMTIQQCQQEAAREVKGLLAAAEKRALARREQAIGEQPGRPQQQQSESPDNVIPIPPRPSAAKGPESTSDFLDRLKRRG